MWYRSRFFPDVYAVIIRAAPAFSLAHTSRTALPKISSTCEHLDVVAGHQHTGDEIKPLLLALELGGAFNVVDVEPSKPRDKKDPESKDQGDESLRTESQENLIPIPSINAVLLRQVTEQAYTASRNIGHGLSNILAHQRLGLEDFRHRFHDGNI
jgi:hypothetical protein